jgi:hypothetical protein
MVRRFFPLFLALIVAGAPTALAMCQADCAAATHSSHAHHGSTGPACHDDGSIPGVTMRGVPPPCGHSGELPAASAVTVQASTFSPSFLAVTTDGAPGGAAILAFFADWRLRDPNPHESVPCRSTVPLRI